MGCAIVDCGVLHKWWGLSKKEYCMIDEVLVHDMVCYIEEKSVKDLMKLVLRAIDKADAINKSCAVKLDTKEGK